jgi:hypothetical protein
MEMSVVTIFEYKDHKRPQFTHVLKERKIQWESNHKLKANISAS